MEQLFKKFDRLKGLKEDSRILLLTHIDLDGEGYAVLQPCFRNTEVRHLTNGQMSRGILEGLAEAGNYDAVMACDISVSETDAVYVEKMPLETRRKFLLLDLI